MKTHFLAAKVLSITHPCSITRSSSTGVVTTPSPRNTSKYKPVHPHINLSNIPLSTAKAATTAPQVNSLYKTEQTATRLKLIPTCTVNRLPRTTALSVSQSQLNSAKNRKHPIMGHSTSQLHRTCMKNKSPSSQVKVKAVNSFKAAMRTRFKTTCPDMTSSLQRSATSTAKTS